MAQFTKKAIEASFLRLAVEKPFEKITVRDIVEDGYETARRILTEHMPELHKLAKYLMEREKISGDEFKIIMEGGELPPLEEPEAAPEGSPGSGESSEDPAP